MSWLPFSQRLRKNHALEHATIAILHHHNPGIRVVARSTGRGFLLYGTVDAAAVTTAVEEAMRRLRAGENSLAIARRCGTTVAVGVLVGTLGLWLNDFMRSPAQKMGLALATGVAIAVSSQPVGLLAQRHITTQPSLGALRVTGVNERSLGRKRYLEVRTAG